LPDRCWLHRRSHRLFRSSASPCRRVVTCDGVGGDALSQHVRNTFDDLACLFGAGQPGTLALTRRASMARTPQEILVVEACARTVPAANRHRPGQPREPRGPGNGGRRSNASAGVDRCCWRRGGTVHRLTIRGFWSARTSVRLVHLVASDYHSRSGCTRSTLRDRAGGIGAGPPCANGHWKQRRRQPSVSPTGPALVIQRVGGPLVGGCLFLTH